MNTLESRDFFNLENRRIVISGANGEIGLCTADKIFKCKGMALGFDNLSQENLGSNNLSFFFQGDVRSEADVATFAEKVLKGGPIHAVICCAGITGEIVDAEKINMQSFSECIEIATSGIANFVKYFCTHFKDRQEGNFIFISSAEAGMKGNALMPAYTASKHAINGLMKSYARELGPWGIRVNSILPGSIDSRMLFHIQKKLEERLNSADMTREIKSIKAELSKLIPMRRLAEPEDIANAIAFLLSDSSKYIHGCMLNIDGGLLVK